MKPCNACGEIQPLDAYRSDSRHRDGHRNRCKRCDVRYQTEYASRKIQVPCPKCGVPREVSYARRARAAKRLCRRCTADSKKRPPGTPAAYLSTTGPKSRGGAYLVRWIDETSGQWRSTTFPTREAAARFRRGLLAEVGPPVSNDPLASAYQLIRKALASVDAARLSRRDEDALMGPLYEAEDVVSALLRVTDRRAA
jgi:hypothetical protein